MSGKKKTNRRSATVPPAPKGLCLLLSMIEPQNNQTTGALYARAREVIGDLDEWREYRAGLARAEETTLLLYPGLETPLDAADVLRAGVLLGAAVSWILLADLLPGGAR